MYFLIGIPLVVFIVFCIHNAMSEWFKSPIKGIDWENLGELDNEWQVDVYDKCKRIDSFSCRRKPDKEEIVEFMKRVTPNISNYDLDETLFIYSDENKWCEVHLTEKEVPIMKSEFIEVGFFNEDGTVITTITKELPPYPVLGGIAYLIDEAKSDFLNLHPIGKNQTLEPFLTNDFEYAYFIETHDILSNINFDPVNHPNHYTDGGIECIEYIKQRLTGEEYRGYLKGNVIKYLHREKNKGGNQDIKKATVYMNWLNEEVQEA